MVATDTVAKELRTQAAGFDSEVKATMGLLAACVAEVEARATAIANLDAAIGALTRDNNPAFSPVVAHLRNQRNNALSELGTAQTQVSQTRSVLDTHTKMRDAFTAAADLLAPVAPAQVKVTSIKGK